MRPKRRADGRWTFRYFEDGTKVSRYRQVTLPPETTKAEVLVFYCQKLGGGAKSTDAETFRA